MATKVKKSAGKKSRPVRKTREELLKDLDDAMRKPMRLFDREPQKKPDKFDGWPQDGVYLVTSDQWESRRISHVGDVPDPMDLAKMEVLRDAILKRTPVTSVEVPTSLLMDVFFKLFAKEAGDQRLLEGIAKAMEADPVSEDWFVDKGENGEATVSLPTTSNRIEPPRPWPDRPVDTSRTVVTPSDFLHAGPIRDTGEVADVAEGGDAPALRWPAMVSEIVADDKERHRVFISLIIAAFAGSLIWFVGTLFHR